jgi:hypothetical protein
MVNTVINIFSGLVHIMDTILAEASTYPSQDEGGGEGVSWARGGVDNDGVGSEGQHFEGPFGPQANGGGEGQYKYTNWNDNDDDDNGNNDGNKGDGDENENIYGDRKYDTYVGDGFSDDGYSGSDNKDTEFSFEAFGKKEAIKTLAYLNDMNNKLYTPPSSDGVGVSNAPVDVAPTDHTSIHRFRRCSSGGYDAHSEGISDVELADWQRSFAYLRVVGTALKVPPLPPAAVQTAPSHIVNTSTSESAAQHSSSFQREVLEKRRSSEMDVDTPLPPSGGIDIVAPAVNGLAEAAAVYSKLSSIAFSDLVVVGTVMPASTVTSSNIEHDHEYGIVEEVICEEGTLSETLYYNRIPCLQQAQPQSSTTEDIDPDIHPDSVQQQDKIQQMLNKIWPQLCTQTLKPLIEAVVHASRKHQLKYADNNSIKKSSHENGGQPALGDSFW